MEQAPGPGGSIGEKVAHVRTLAQRGYADRVDEPMMKGATIRELFTWYEQTHGRERVRRMAARAPADLRALLDPDEPLVRILASTWYPARLVHSMLDTVTDGLTEAEVDKLARDCGRAFTTSKLRGVYKLLFARIVSPEMYASNIQRMWSLIHDTGERRIDIVGPGEARSVIANWPGHHRVLCQITVGTMCALLETMGCKSVDSERVSCVSGGAKECVSRVMWQK